MPRFFNEDMSQFTAPFYESLAAASRIQEQPHWLLQDCGWVETPVPPHVEVAIAAVSSGFLLHFSVKENELRAVNTQINSPVYEDSCVEFFVSFHADGSYYNLEFNSIGAILAGYGESRSHRDYLSPERIRTIEVTTKHHSQDGQGMIRWELQAFVPVSFFHEQQPVLQRGATCFANFYKCGDKLKHPHFFSWQPVKVEEPNFHMPAFFGDIQFT